MNRTLQVFLAIILFLIAFGLVAQFAPMPNQGFASNTAVLSIITASAIAIERVLEAFWTIIGMTKGAWWPLNIMSKQVNECIDQLDQTLQPVYEKAQAAIEKVAEANQWTRVQVGAARKEIDGIENRITELKKLSPDNQRVDLITTTAFQNVSYLTAKYKDYYPEIMQAGTVATQAITGVTDFVASFKDNPGRRLISIYVGAVLGLIIAGLIGLDIFQATLETIPTSNNFVLPHLGVALTGLIMGLGSSPTHDVIRVLQEYKKSRRLANTPGQGSGGSTSDEGVGGGGGPDLAPRSAVSTYQLRR
jgi:hypothetical protein